MEREFKIPAVGHDLQRMDLIAVTPPGPEQSIHLMKAFQSKFSDDEDNRVDYSPSRAEDEDDIPLAQRIPGALQAQKSIRIRHRAYSTRTKSEAGAETKIRANQSTFEVTELTRKLVKLNNAQPINGTDTQWSVHNNPNHTRSPSPSLLPAPPSSLNVSNQTKSRPRNKSFSQQTIPRTDLIRNPSATPLSRSTTQSAPKVSPKTVQLSALEQFPTESSSTRSSINPPSRSQTLLVRSRSKSFSSSSLSKNSESFSPPIDQPPLPFSNHRPTNNVQLQVPLQPKCNVVQQRIFIESMQRFNNVQIYAQTCAYEILTKIVTQEELGSRDPADASKNWMLWELAQDFGLERPIRHYERPSEIYASWNSNTLLNAFMLRRTSLSSILAPDRIPSSSPICSGYVQWETKRGKWNKRWMELKEHSIWLSKRNTGKDRTFLCSLSSFDCYFMSRPYKAPKAFIFALKSTDNLTMFEDPADYLHIFSCDQGDGPRWTQSLLLARSYILHKERTILFMSPTSPTIPASHESRDHKSLPVPKKPLPDPRARSGGSGFNKAEVFQSGSLLARS